MAIANAALVLHFVFDNKTPEEQFLSNARVGKQLAEKYCRSCHGLPDPALLSKDVWIAGVLPTMGPLFGINSFKGVEYLRMKDVDSSRFPKDPVLDSLEWQKISDYYYSAAPAYLPAQDKDLERVRVLPYFSIELPKDQSVFGKVAMTSYVKIDTSINPRRILVNDAMSQKLYVFDAQLNLLKINQGLGLITDIDFQSNQILASNLGDNVEANNQRKGDVSQIQMDKYGVISKVKTLFDKLARPVKITHVDLDNDGKMDYITSEFGNIIGNLTWMQNKGKGIFQKKIVRDRPGVLNTIVDDYNKDGLKDIWALFAQGDEGVFVFTNKGKGNLEEKQVLRFPPSYGSTWFDLVDFNDDGYQDIIYTCGDNADYTPILKPYHGVYIYLNDGKNNFKQKYFYPINGCYKAIAKDFDHDGKKDIAAISFFPSSLQPEEAFTYLKNNGNYNFSAFKLPITTPFEKGITMDVADLDQDGRLDILLGNGYYNSKEADNHKEPLFIILRNNIK
ncbi:FG-GAP repeat domain-containing protein [Pedobacter jejuensis]|uniref:FG-GAP repeat domain-containing protein n=1 Tax=Pedobacter jejuensis TaxID=1268550 RepID=UPI0011CE7DDE|nr:VCBS repeat-containing protein [Pedobacter jejuensis]